MDNPGDAKYGMTRAQIAEAYKLLRAKGAKSSGSTRFWPPTHFPTNTFRLSPRSCFNWRLS